MAVILVIIVGQILIVTFGGPALSTTPLTAREWAISLFLGFLSLPVGVAIRLVPDDSVRALLGALGVRRNAAASPEEELRRRPDAGSPWHRALQQVRCELVEARRRRRRSSRLQRLWLETLAAVRRRLLGEARDDEDDEADGEEGAAADERRPLLGPRSSRPSPASG